MFVLIERERGGEPRLSPFQSVSRGRRRGGRPVQGRTEQIQGSRGRRIDADRVLENVHGGGRYGENEINNLMRVLCRRNKNNPILIGNPGVGKTSIAKLLAQLIVDKKVPDTLKDLKIIQMITNQFLNKD